MVNLSIVMLVYQRVASFVSKNTWLENHISDISNLLQLAMSLTAESSRYPSLLNPSYDAQFFLKYVNPGVIKPKRLNWVPWCITVCIFGGYPHKKPQFRNPGLTGIGIYKSILSGWWFEPIWKIWQMWVRQLGWRNYQLNEQKKHVENHQPVDHFLRKHSLSSHCY